jgi:hypothetical protein
MTSTDIKRLPLMVPAKTLVTSSPPAMTASLHHLAQSGCSLGRRRARPARRPERWKERQPRGVRVRQWNRECRRTGWDRDSAKGRHRGRPKARCLKTLRRGRRLNPIGLASPYAANAS